MVNIFYSSEFRKEVKRLAKIENPLEGADLGFGVRKVRMSIKSKGKGKSGGARVITYNVTETEDTIDITLLTIYDKSERSNISDKEINDLLKSL